MINLPLSTVNPRQHACDTADLDYSQVADGLVTCTVCPRRWHLVPVFSGGARWVNSCEVFMPGATRADWWEHNELEEIVPPTEEEVLASRELRLAMLDQKAREHAQYLQDSGWGFDWLQKERGSGGKVDHEWYTEMLAGTHKPAKRPRHKLRMTIRFPSVQSTLAFLRKMNSRGS